MEFAPAQLDPTSGQAATYLLIVEATVRLMDVVNDEPIFESDEFILRDEFAISEDPDASLDREGLAFQRIASAFADSLLVAITRGLLGGCGETHAAAGARMPGGWAAALCVALRSIYTRYASFALLASLGLTPRTPLPGLALRLVDTRPSAHGTSTTAS